MQTQTNPITVPSKSAILSALRAFVAQRSGLDCRNYGDRDSLMGDYRPILRDGKNARLLLRQIELRESITAENLSEACKRAFSGRVALDVTPLGTVCVNYCTGQYFATEYRAAVCAVCASVFWAYFRECVPVGGKSTRGLNSLAGTPCYGLGNRLWRWGQQANFRVRFRIIIDSPMKATDSAAATKS